MRIFLDARDLISLLEGRGPCSVGEFRKCLQDGGHLLALSPIVVSEVAAPLADPLSNTVVATLLNDLESLPLIYVSDGQIPHLELSSASRSYTAGREYVAIDPYVASFDEATPVSEPAPAAPHLNLGLAETVLTIWRKDPRVFYWPDELVNRLQLVMATDRSMASPPSVTRNFRAKIRRDLDLDGIPTPLRPDEFADWIYETPTRCPGVRLNYEVYHQLRRNVGDQPSASDFGDFAHVQCVPYVDLITLDRRMADYVRRATRNWADDPAGKIRHDLGAIVREL